MKEIDVFLFIPNLIGYGRIVLALMSFYFMPKNYIFASLCYLLSGFLDAIDGHAARLLNQSSKFGAMLDQLTDRCATMCLIVNLAFFYPKWMFLFQLLLIIDIASHWLHVQSSFMVGLESHKKMDLSKNKILKVYYTNRKVLFCMCAGNELFYSLLYILHFTSGPILQFGSLSFGIFTMLCWITAPIAFIKTGISCVQLCYAAVNVVSLDVADVTKRDKNK